MKPFCSLQLSCLSLLSVSQCISLLVSHSLSLLRELCVFTVPSQNIFVSYCLLLFQIKFEVTHAVCKMAVSQCRMCHMEDPLQSVASWLTLAGKRFVTPQKLYWKNQSINKQTETAIILNRAEMIWTNIVPDRNSFLAFLESWNLLPILDFVFVTLKW